MRVVFCCLLTVSHLLILGQDNGSGELIEQKLEEPDTVKARAYLKAAKSFFKVDPDSTYHYAELALKYSPKNSIIQAEGEEILGEYYLYQGIFDWAFQHFFDAQHIFESHGEKRHLAEVLNFIGDIYRKQRDYANSLNYYQRSIAIAAGLNDRAIYSENLNNIGDIYRYQEQIDSAMMYYEKGLAIDEEDNRLDGLCDNWNNIGDLFKTTGDYEQAVIYYKKSLEGCRKQKNHLEITENLASLADAKLAQLEYKEALEYLDEAIAVAERFQYLEEATEAFRIGAKIHTQLENWEDALAFNQRYIDAKDQLFDIKKFNAINLLRKDFEEEQQSHQLELEHSMLLNANQQRNSSLFILLLAVIGGVFLFRENRRKQKINALLDQRNLELQQQKQLIEKAQIKMNDSVRYAQTIQHAVLPLSEEISPYFPEHFVIYDSKDMVSGDFYWFQVAEDSYFLASVDCTGHGIPGAFMSMIGNTVLNQIVNSKHIVDPEHMLEGLHREIQLHLKQEHGINDDGMDVSLCRIHFKDDQQSHWKVEFAGAKLPLFYTDEAGEVKRIKGSNKMIGGQKKQKNKVFKRHSLSLPSGSMIYLASDGIMDQKGTNGKTLGTPAFMQWLEAIHTEGTSTQKQYIEEQLATHQGNEEQIDDITIFAIRLP